MEISALCSRRPGENLANGTAQTRRNGFTETFSFQRYATLPRPWLTAGVAFSGGHPTVDRIFSGSDDLSSADSVVIILPRCISPYDRPRGGRTIPRFENRPDACNDVNTSGSTTERGTASVKLCIKLSRNRKGIHALPHKTRFWRNFLFFRTSVTGNVSGTSV